MNSLWILELTASAYLTGLILIIPWLNLASVILIWLITGFRSARTHHHFETMGFTLPLFKDLMKWNRIRMLIWCTRSILIFTYVIRGFE